jgi:hypothetical protein
VGRAHDAPETNLTLGCLHVLHNCSLCPAFVDHGLSRPVLISNCPPLWSSLRRASDHSQSRRHPAATGSSTTGVPPGRGRPPAQPRRRYFCQPGHLHTRRAERAGGPHGRPGLVLDRPPARVGNGAPSRICVIKSTHENQITSRSSQQRRTSPPSGSRSIRAPRPRLRRSRTPRSHSASAREAGSSRIRRACIGTIRRPARQPVLGSTDTK